MKVCIDIQAAVAQRAGVGRYTKALVEHLGADAGPDDLELFYFDFKRNGTPFATPGAHQHAVRWCPGRLIQYAWKKLNAPPFDWFAGPADVYHFPNFIRPPLTRGTSVVTIHDVAFLRHPETLEKRNYTYLTSRIRETVARADAVITVSDFVAAEIEELLQVPRSRIVAIHEGLEEHVVEPGETDIAKARSALGLTRPYLLNVGTLEPRKNALLLVNIFEKLKSFDGDLVVAGMRGWNYEPILERMRSSSHASRIRYLDFVPEEHLSALYAGAELFVFPSLYEGFGFPPLEAMACGTPVLSSSAGSLPEVLGKAAVIMADFDAAHWAQEIDALITNSERLDKLRKSGVSHSRGFSWATTASRTWEVYREVAGLTSQVEG